MDIASMVHIRTCTSWHLSQLYLPHGKLFFIFSPWSYNFCNNFCSLCFLWLLESFSFLPVLIKTWCCAWVLWTLVLPDIQFNIKLRLKKAISKRKLCLLSLVLWRMLLNFPVGGSAHLFPDLVQGIWRIWWHIEVLSDGILLALSIKNKRVL